MATTELVKREETALAKMLNSELKNIQRSLPSHIKPDKFIAVALQAASNSLVAQCTPVSVVKAIVEASQLGLMLDSRLGLAYLVPYKQTCQLLIGYKGLIHLGRNSGEVALVRAENVYSNEPFEVRYGTTPILNHTPILEESKRGDWIASYATCHLKNGAVDFELMSREEIEKIQRASKAAKYEFSPWQTWPEEMRKKTTIRRGFKRWPVSVEAQVAAARDEYREIVQPDIDTEIVMPRAIGEAPDEPPAPETSPRAAEGWDLEPPPDEAQDTGRKITEAEWKEMQLWAGNRGWTTKELNNRLMGSYGVRRHEELTLANYEDFKKMVTK